MHFTRDDLHFHIPHEQVKWKKKLVQPSLLNEKILEKVISKILYDRVWKIVIVYARSIWSFVLSTLTEFSTPYVRTRELRISCDADKSTRTFLNKFFLHLSGSNLTFIIFPVQRTDEQSSKVNRVRGHLYGALKKFLWWVTSIFGTSYSSPREL